MVVLVPMLVPFGQPSVGLMSVFPLLPEHLARQFLLTVYQNVYLGCCNSAAVHAREFQACSYVQRRYRFLEEVPWYSGVDQSAEKHVAADPGETIEVGNAHIRVAGLSSLVVGTNRRSANGCLAAYHECRYARSRFTSNACGNL